MKGVDKMAAAKMIPVLNDQGNERFEASDSFVESLSRNYVETKGPDGRTIRVNKKFNRNDPAVVAAVESQDSQPRG
jgi:hypothetical protein